MLGSITQNYKYDVSCTKLMLILKSSFSWSKWCQVFDHQSKIDREISHWNLIFERGLKISHAHFTINRPINGLIRKSFKSHTQIIISKTTCFNARKQIENYKTLVISKHLSFNSVFIIFILEFLNSFITVPICKYEKLWELERF